MYDIITFTLEKNRKKETTAGKFRVRGTCRRSAADRCRRVHKTDVRNPYNTRKDDAYPGSNRTLQPRLTREYTILGGEFPSRFSPKSAF